MATLRFVGRLVSPLCGLLIWTIAATAEDLSKLIVNGQTLEIYKGEPPILVSGDKVLLRPADGIAWLSFEGAYEDAGNVYALVSLGTGGNLCPAFFQIIDVTTSSPKVSDQFGTCSDMPSAQASGGALEVTLPRMDGKGDTVFRYKAGTLTEFERNDNLAGVGPDNAPGGNIAIYVASKHIGDAIKLKAVVNKLKTIMTEADFEDARDLALSGPGTDFKITNEYATAFACEKHNCGEHWVRIMFDQTGGAWASSRSGNKLKFFGDPPHHVQRMLTAE